MKSWTRTLNLDDSHTLLALAEPGRPVVAWARASEDALPRLSRPRQQEMIRILRQEFLDEERGCIAEGPFIQAYHRAPAVAQVELVSLQWALSHPLSLLAAESLVAPALTLADPTIPLDAVEGLVAERLTTASAESRRKTRTVLLGALENVGTLITRGTGQHRSVRASRGTPHFACFAYLLRRELRERGIDAMMAAEAIESSLPTRLTLCTHDHAREAVRLASARGLLDGHGDEVGLPTASR